MIAQIIVHTIQVKKQEKVSAMYSKLTYTNSLASYWTVAHSTFLNS